LGSVLTSTVGTLEAVGATAAAGAGEGTLVAVAGSPWWSERSAPAVHTRARRSTLSTLV
jgi:hypothetical protein